MSFPESRVERSGQAVGPAGVPSTSDAAINELTNRLRSHAESAASVAPQEPLLASAALRYAIAVLVTMCILSAAVFFGLRLWPNAGDAARTLATRVASTLPILRNLAQEPAQADDPPQLPSAPAGSHRSAHVVRLQRPLVSRPSIAAAFVAPKLFVDRPSIPPVAVVEEPDDPNVYSSADREVAPPRARLTDVPGPPLGGLRAPEDLLEVLVNDKGVVEHAKLHTSDPRMLDPMLLSRVKTWRFDPALRNGHPVAYRLLLAWDGSQFKPEAAAEDLLPAAGTASR